MKPEWIILTGAILAVLIVLAPTLVRRRRRKQLLSRPFPGEWQELLRQNMPLYKRLPDSLRERLHDAVRIFLGEKYFVGCNELEITDEIRVTIAAQACLIILGRNNNYFPKVQTIYVYPSTYMYRSADGEEDAHLGESWGDGRIVLSWDASRRGAANIRDAQNVVIHEFAHQLDQVDGSADGAPVLEEPQTYAIWGEVFAAEYEKLQRKRRPADHVMNEYGATNPAEFFAVATEAFFEKPFQLQRKHNALYEELKQFYNLNPVEWF